VSHFNVIYFTQKRKGLSEGQSLLVKESTFEDDLMIQDDVELPKESEENETEIPVGDEENNTQPIVESSDIIIVANSFDARSGTLPSVTQNDLPKVGSSTQDDEAIRFGNHASDLECEINESNKEVETKDEMAIGSHPEESKEAATQDKNDTSITGNTDPPKDDHTWETVEVRARGSRKKTLDRGGHGRFHSHQNHGFHSHHNQKKPKTARTTASRKRLATRKIVRDILSSVLDAVDDEVRRRRQVSRDGARPTENSWAAALTRSTMNNSNDIQPPGNQNMEAAKRDVAVGRQSGNPSRSLSASAAQYSQRMHSDRMRLNSNAASGRNANENRKGREKAEINSSEGGAKPGGQTALADQNTAPTVQETLSAVSANSLNTDARRGSGSRKGAPVRETGVARSDSSSGGSAEMLKPQLALSTLQAGKEGSPPPPLPTLLSPGNANSASSSVASSLDAPHAGHPHHHCFSTANENDVGYHLLDVCDRLTREMDVFMTRRSHALNVRRNERSAVLTALQKSLSVSTVLGNLRGLVNYGANSVSSCVTDPVAGQVQCRDVRKLRYTVRFTFIRP
jgi:hypothetical protein